MKNQTKRKIEKKQPIEVIRKVRSRMRETEVYYNNSSWQTKEIEGVMFLPVSRVYPESGQNVTIFYMKKDSLEYVK
jgi:hypothetical protein